MVLCSKLREDKKKVFTGFGLFFFFVLNQVLTKKTKSSSPGFGPSFCPKLGVDQKEKMVIARVRIEFCDRILFQVQSQSSHILIANANGGGGLFSVLVQKPVSKVLKTGYFAYSACQWGKACSLLLPGYSTKYLI